MSGIYAANRALALLSSMWNRGIHNDLTKLPNPCQAIEPFKEKSRSRRLGTEEMTRFIAAVEAEPSDTIRDWVWVSLLTAQRRGNVISMRFDDVDLQCRRWTIPETKSGEAHIVPLHPHVLEIIKRRRVENPESEWLFPGRSDGKGGHLCQPQHGWNRILDRAGIKDLHIHDLRRTFASYMADMGASLPMIGSALAHRDTATTAVYARIALNPVEDAMNLAGDAILNQARIAKDEQK